MPTTESEPHRIPRLPVPGGCKRRRSADLPVIGKISKLEPFFSSRKKKKLRKADMEPDLDEMANIVVVELQEDDEDCVETAMEKLDDLLTFEINNDAKQATRRDAIELGAPAIILNAMKSYLCNEEIQAFCCRCIGKLSYMNTDAKKLFARIGGIEAVVKTLRAYPKHNEVQEAATFALRNLLISPCIVAKFGKRLVSDFDLLRDLMASVCRFSKNDKIEEHCCAIFCLLSDETGLRNTVKSAGVVDLVDDLLKQNDDESVQVWVKRLKANYGDSIWD